MTPSRLLLAAHERPGNILDRPQVDPATLEFSADHGQRQRALVAPRDDPSATGEHISGPDNATSSLTKAADFRPKSQPGDVIAGRYTLLEEVGEGGMGVAWVAKQTEPVKRKISTGTSKCLCRQVRVAAPEGRGGQHQSTW